MVDVGERFQRHVSSVRGQLANLFAQDGSEETENSPENGGRSLAYRLLIRAYFSRVASVHILCHHHCFVAIVESQAIDFTKFFFSQPLFGRIYHERGENVLASGVRNSIYPPLPGGDAVPVWLGNGFKVGEASTRVLHYEAQSSGWSESLGGIREEITGSDHPIDLSSRSSAVEQIKRNCSTAAPVILEVGCLAGYMLRDLAAAFPGADVIGSDYLPGPLDTLGQELPDIPLLQFDLKQCPLPDASVDVVVILNVLEHIDDDKLALEQVHRILRPGGIAVIEVPAGPELYDFYDEFWKHWRRYNASDFSRLVRNVGFEVIFQGHLGTLIFPLFWWVKKLNRFRAGWDKKAKREAVMKSNSSSSHSLIMRVAMKVENMFSNVLRKLPFGIRIVITCRKA